MYIKQVVIKGFKSYREETATATFCPKVNCVVGANGSGKSNFFHAIRFVISDVSNLRSEERQALLHEGAAHQVLSAFVEIVFDNSDNRIPVDKEEVRIKRKISVKKDEYFLNNHSIKKTQVVNLLESAGFSRSNPYYVVQQGKIASLTVMKDSERLDLLKEIGGSGVYEERRRQSLEIMHETGNKREQIIQVVQYLDDRLQEIDEEEEELRKYEQLDRQKKALEYTVYEKEQHDANQHLLKINEDLRKVTEKSGKMRGGISDAHDKCKELDQSLKELTKRTQVLSREKEEIEKQRMEAIEKCAKLEVNEKDLRDRIEGNAKTKKDAKMQLEQLEKDILESNAELTRINQVYDEQFLKKENLTQRITECEKQLSILYQKQSRAMQFASKEARDQWLQEEIDGYEQVLSSNLLQEKKLGEEIEQLNIREQDAYKMGRKDAATELKSLIYEYGKDYNQYKLKRDKLQDERKSLWVSESELSAEIGRLESEVVKAEKGLDHAIPGDIRRGLNSVSRICNQDGVGGVYGTLIELLECDEKYFKAVEVTAGIRLFHVVVENDDISTRLIGQLNAQKGGRVTFIPLNRVLTLPVEYPHSSDVKPLLQNLKFSGKYRSAFDEVFGRAVICRDLDVATRVAREYGDQVNIGGVMTGGFYDYRRSRLKLMRTVIQNRKSIKMKKEQLNAIKAVLQQTEQKINELMTDHEKDEAKFAYDKSLLKQMKEDSTNAKKQRDSILESLEKKENLLSTILNQINQIRAKIVQKKDEMGSELVDQLTPEEKESLSRLNPEITNLKEQLIICRDSLIEMETKKAEVKTNLCTNLVRRKEELEAVKVSAETDMLQGADELKKGELKETNLFVDQLTQQLNEVNESIDQRNRELEDIKVERHRLKSLEDEYKSALQDEEREEDQLLGKKKIYLAKKEEYSKKIRELRSLSSDAFEMYNRKSINELHKELHKCNEKLQQFSHVNKKAHAYDDSKQKREDLERRRAELDAGDEKIKELIENLDTKKDESIGHTFKRVAKHFQQVFSELVQGGHGNLVMVKKKETDDANHDQDDEEPHPAEAGGTVEKYSGVKVKVSFSGQGETQTMKQLSGGQKTVVALALIFAIQRSDPAPFYLFDEIDAALDPQYRTAVANMVRRLADKDNTQFITTTFRPELVNVADKIYGVTYRNRVSDIQLVSKQGALNFIEH